MDARARTAFLLLILAQTAHSLEEYVFRLYDALPPARYVADLAGIGRAAGFAAVNTALVLFGLCCWFALVRRGRRPARAIAWGWALVEIANGLGHAALAVVAGGYFPGLATAPLLLAAAGYLMVRLSGTPAT